MSLSDSRLTRTSAATSTTTSSRTSITSTTSRRRERAIVRAAVRTTVALQATRTALVAAAHWAGRTVRPAGALVVVAATVGLAIGIAFGWVEWMVAGAVSVLLILMGIPFLFGARSYEVDLTITHETMGA